jgi:hypothetical protein
LKRRFLVLAGCDQLHFWRFVGERLSAEGSEVRRQETLACIRCAADHLGLARPPKVAEYDAAVKELELPWSWQRIHRLWGSFAVAAAVAFGAKAPQWTQQRTYASRYGGVAPSQREEYFTAVRQWLATNPVEKGAAAYNAYARAYNYTLAPDALPLPRHRRSSPSWRCRGAMSSPSPAVRSTIPLPSGAVSKGATGHAARTT